MEKIINRILKWKYFYLSIVIIFSLVFLSPLLFFYIDGDDTNFHLMNIDIYSNLSIFSKIVPVHANNLGWGVGIFYPCLPHIMGAIFLKVIKNFGYSYILAIRLVKVIIVILSGINMYFLGYKVYKSKLKGMFAALFYLSSSYFFVDFYMRDALNESMIFIFMPLIFLSLIYLFNENNNKIFYILFISGYIGMIYSHLLLTMWFTIFLVFFLILYIKKIFNKKYFFPLLISTIIVIIFTSTFVFPLVEHMILDNWYIPAYKKVWVLPFKGYFYPDYYLSGTHNLIYIKFSYIILVLFFLGIYNLIFSKKYKYDKKFILGILIFSVLSMILTSLNIFWENSPSFFKSIQFAWRLATFATFGVSLFSVSALDNIYNLFKEKYKFVMTLILIIILSIFTYQNFSKVTFYKNVGYGMTFGCKDYFPKKAIKNIGYLENLDSNSISIIDGKAKIKILKNDIPYLKFKVSNVSDYAVIELPRFYYLGYEITDKKGKKINYTEDKYGLIKIKISSNGIYELKYTGTNMYRIAIILKSALLIIIFITLSTYILKKVKNKKVHL